MARMAASSPAVRPLDLDPGPDAEAASLAVVTGPGAAGALLDPTRQRILEALREPGSATTVAAALGVSRQLANYHVRALERAGLVTEVGRRPRRGLEERVVRATATHYLIAPDVVDERGSAGGPAPPGGLPAGDRFSASYQVAAAARTIREVAALAAGARAEGKRLTTLTLDTEVRFATPARREAFANELVALVTGLVARYHDAEAPDGRRYRLVTGAHPVYVPPASPAVPPARSPGRQGRRPRTSAGIRVRNRNRKKRTR
jgi:DNA-binding transcriptional ArsR family regulator